MALTFAHFGPKIGILVYIDDVICSSSTWEGHLKLLKDTFKALNKAGLILKLSKIQFGSKQVKFIGYALSVDGMKIGKNLSKL